MLCNPDAVLTIVIHVDIKRIIKNGSSTLQVYQVLVFKFSKRDLNLNTGMTICIIFSLQGWEWNAEQNSKCQNTMTTCWMANSALKTVECIFA